MECDAHWIGCELRRLNETLEQQQAEFPWLEVFSLVVALLAAAGTLWIAWVNYKLLKRQHELEANVAAVNERSKRAAFLAVLNGEISHILSSQVAGLKWSITERQSYWTELNRLGMLVSGTSWKDLNRCVVTIATYSGITHRDGEGWLRTQELISERTDAWLEDPENADLSVPDEYLERKAASKESFV